MTTEETIPRDKGGVRIPVRNEQSITRLPSLALPAPIYLELGEYVKEAEGEISLFGEVEVALGDLLVTRLHLPPQSATGSSTCVTEEDQASMLQEMLDTKVDISRLHLWAHSHGSMSVFWSPVDDTTLKTSFPLADWVAGIVANKRGEMKAALLVYRPVPLQIWDLPIRVLEDVGSVERASIRAAIGAKVRQQKWPAVHLGWHAAVQTGHLTAETGGTSVPVRFEQAGPAQPCVAERGWK